MLVIFPSSFCWAEDDSWAVVTADGENQKSSSVGKIAPTVPKYRVCKIDWDKYQDETSVKFKKFVRTLPKNLSEKEMAQKWLDFVSNDLNMKIFNNYIVKTVIMTPVGMALDVFSTVKKAVNMDSKFENGSFYLYKGKDF